MNRERVEQALARIEAAASRIEQAAVRPAPAPASGEMDERFARLRAEVGTALSELDALIGSLDG